MRYIYSILANTTCYALYDRTIPERPVCVKKIEIKGGALVADRFAMSSSGAILTPKGLVTQIIDEDYELLKTDYHFNEHVKNGFIKVENSKIDVEKAISDMEKRDNSSPKIPADYEEALKKAANPDEIPVPKGIREKKRM